MKVKFYLLGLIAGALNFTGCSKEEAVTPDTPASDEITLYFPSEDPSIYNGDGTRTEFVDGVGIGFKKPDKVRIHSWFMNGDTPSRNKDGASVNRNAAGDVAGAVKTNLLATGRVFNFVFTHPAHSEAKSESFGFEKVGPFNLAVNQTPTISSFDPQFDLLVSKKVSVKSEDIVNEGKEADAILPKVLFKRLTTFFKVVLPKAEMEGLGQSVESVKIKALGNETLGGICNVPISDDAALTVPEWTTTTSEITATPKESVSEGTNSELVYGPDAKLDKDVNVWFCLNPIQVKGLELVITTDTHIITLPINKQVTFQPKTINVLKFLKSKVPAGNIVEKGSVVKETYFEKNLTIDGQTYNKVSTGAKLVDPAGIVGPSKTPSVLYIQDNAIVNKSATVVSDLVFIGNDVNNKADLKFTTGSYFNFNGKDAKLIFKNLKIDFASSTLGYALQARGPVGTIYFEDCEIVLDDKQLLYTRKEVAAENLPNRIVLKNCKINSPITSDRYLIQLTGPDEVIGRLQEISFENCLIYSPVAPQGKKTAIVNMMNGKVGDKTIAPNLVLNFTNNTVLDYAKYYGIFNVPKQVKSVNIDKNIFYIEDNTIESAILGYVKGQNITGDIKFGDNKVSGGNKECWYKIALGDKDPNPENEIKTDSSILKIGNRTNGEVTVNVPGYGSTLK